VEKKQPKLSQKAGEKPAKSSWRKAGKDLAKSS